MSLVHILSATAASLQTLVAALVIYEAARLRRAIPPVVWGVAAFLAIDALVALNRSELLWSRSGSYYVATSLDIAAILVIVAIIPFARRLVRAAVATVDLSAFRAEEYARARQDYIRLARHRIMNPLTVVDGAAKTLRAGTTMDERTRTELLDAIIDSAATLRELSVEPEREGVEEHEIEARPRRPA